MANSIPFNAVSEDGEYDRVYKAEDWAWYFATFISNGVFPKPSDGLQVAACDGMEVRVNAGYAFINGYAFRNPSARNVTIDRAEGAQNRIDRVVVRWDLPQRDIYIAVLKGAPSARPVATAITRNAEIWELAIADIYVGKGVIRIRTQDIKDQRFNSAVCGIVAGTVKEIDAGVLTRQFDDFFDTYSRRVLSDFDAYREDIEEKGARAEEICEEFATKAQEYLDGLKESGDDGLAAIIEAMREYRIEAGQQFDLWFNNLTEQLSGDVAGNLQNEINNIRATLREITDEEIDAMIEGAYESDGGGMEPDIYSRVTDEEIEGIVKKAFGGDGQ